MNTRFGTAHLAMAAALVAGTDVTAQTPGPFVYAGFLEENGIPVDGTRNVVLTPFSGALDATSCAPASFATIVEVNAGRFSIPLDNVPAPCLATGELFLEVAVGEVDGALVPLLTSGGAARIALAPSPFAAAAQAGGLDARQGVVFSPSKGPSSLIADGGNTALRLRPSGPLLGTDPLWTVEGTSGRAMLSVLNLDRVALSGALSLGKPPGSALSRIDFERTPGSSGDPGAIVHDEQSSLLWLNSSDDWDVAGQVNDLIIFGEPVGNFRRHTFDAVGNATHAGALTVAGNASVAGTVTVGRLQQGCDTGFTAASRGRVCISNTLFGPQGMYSFTGDGDDPNDGAVAQCRALDAHVCSYSEITQACNVMNPYAGVSGSGGNQCLWFGDTLGDNAFNHTCVPFVGCDNNDRNSGGADAINGRARYRCCY